MRRTILIFVCLLAVSVGSLAGAAVVLASGTNTSAGDQQYVDPLTGTNSTSHGSSSSSSSSGSSSGASSSAGSSSASQMPSASSGSSTSTGSTATATQAAAGGKSLPFTGMNVGVCIALGLGLLGAGVALRRVVRSA